MITPTPKTAAIPETRVIPETKATPETMGNTGDEDNTENEGDKEPEPTPPIYYTAKFESGVSTSVQDQSVESGKTAAEPTKPEKVGYIFDGWYVGNDKWNFTTPITAALTLTAKWTECTSHTPNANGDCSLCKTEIFYTVTFVTEKNETVESQTVKHGAKVTAPTLTRVGCDVLVGWTCADNADWSFATRTVTSELTLTAKWKLECIFGDWTVSKEATCSAVGEETRTCSTGTHTETRELDKVGHKYSEIYSFNETAHWRECVYDGCTSKKSPALHKSDAPATTESAEYCKTCGYMMKDKLHMLSNKKIIFIGNSHFFYSDVVLEKKTDNTSLSNRQNDKGTFYDIAEANGAVGLKVTNWTYGNHTFKDFFSGNCQANRDCGNGYNHLKDLTDLNYDYVVLQHGLDSADVREEWMEFAINMFKEANPNVRFILVVPARTHDASTAARAKLLPKIKEYEAKHNMIVVNWGGLVYDIYRGAVKVPGALLTYNKESFVIAKDSSDGYHPNLLAGYITSLMTYCAITGEKAVGQKWNYYTE